MFNVTILRLKDIIKYLTGMVILIAAIYIITNAIPKLETNGQKIKQEMQNQAEAISQNSFLSCFEILPPVPGFFGNFLLV